MGISGLTTFINNRSCRYLEYYELHNTYLVIDGNSVVCQIYNWYAKCNCAFGGDYDKYAQSISEFFDKLLKCNVTPLVLFDGGCEDKKLKTVILRAKEKIRSGLHYCPTSQHRTKFLPLFIKDVFKDVVREKGVRFVQCLFEADNAIAAVARMLNCPVLSYDSDFYIYGTLYVPFDTVESHIVKRPDGIGYMIRCKVYRVENFVSSFRGLNQAMLPLAAILLGNDYVKRGTFKHFFQQMKLHKIIKKKTSQQQRRIEATFMWLSRYSLNNAVVVILSRVPKPLRKIILDIIEKHVNGYETVPPEILVPLGFSHEYINHIHSFSATKTFKFDGDIYDLPDIGDCSKENLSDVSESEGEDEKEMDEAQIPIVNAIQESEIISNENLNHNLPQWFIDDFIMGNFPAYFMDLIVRSLYICPVQIEDYSFPSTIEASLNIIGVIYGLLVSGVHTKNYNMRYIARGERGGVKHCKLEYPSTVLSCKYPSLHNLKDLPVMLRKEILISTLGIVDMGCLNDLPPEWFLYVATVKYWIDQAQKKYFKLHCHFYSLLLCMLFNRVDQKIGRYRSLRAFQNKHGELISQIQYRRKMADYKPYYSTDVSVAQAFHDLDADDCLLAAAFFISNFEFDQKLNSNPKKFDRTIVHSFAEFQNCLRHSMNLNALLGYPYQQSKVANLFNGTFLYNVCNNFKSRHNVETYISAVLQNSPSLLRLFNVLLSKVKPSFTKLFENNVSGSGHKKQKTRAKLAKSAAESDHEQSDTASEVSCDASFHDPYNRFTVFDNNRQMGL